MEESEAIFKDVLAEPFDFSKNEEFNSDYENLTYVKNKKQLKERWNYSLNILLLQIMMIFWKNKKRSWKMIPDYQKKTDKEIEIEARELTLRSLEEYYDILDDLERKDWFAVYINAIVEEFDPHTIILRQKIKMVLI